MYYKTDWSYGITFDVWRGKWRATNYDLESVNLWEVLRKLTLRHWGILHGAQYDSCIEYPLRVDNIAINPITWCPEVKTISAMLDSRGYSYLRPLDCWDLLERAIAIVKYWYIRYSPVSRSEDPRDYQLMLKRRIMKHWGALLTTHAKKAMYTLDVELQRYLIVIHASIRASAYHSVDTPNNYNPDVLVFDKEYCFE